MADVSGIRKMLEPLARRLRGMIKRGTIERIDDSSGTQTVQTSLLSDEVADGVEHMQPHGMSFRPPTGSDAVVLAVAGDPAHLVALAASKRGSRPTDAANEGEGGLHYLGEWKVFLAEDGSVHLGGKDPSDWAALASKVKKLEADFIAHFHNDSLGSPTGGPLIQPGDPEAEPGPPQERDYASSKVKLD